MAEDVYRSEGDFGSMWFNRTLVDWAKFDINKEPNMMPQLVQV